MDNPKFAFQIWGEELKKSQEKTERATADDEFDAERANLMRELAASTAQTAHFQELCARDRTHRLKEHQDRTKRCEENFSISEEMKQQLQDRAEDKTKRSRAHAELERITEKLDQFNALHPPSEFARYDDLVRNGTLTEDEDPPMHRSMPKQTREELARANLQNWGRIMRIFRVRMAECRERIRDLSETVCEWDTRLYAFARSLDELSSRIGANCLWLRDSDERLVELDKRLRESIMRRRESEKRTEALIKMVQQLDSDRRWIKYVRKNRTTKETGATHKLPARWRHLLEK